MFFGLTNSAETGSNAGSNGRFSLYGDDGVTELRVFDVVRAAGGALTLARPLTLNSTLILPLTGLLKGNGAGVVTVGASGTDFVGPSAYASANGLTLATSRLLGRTTAATGPAEEITVGSGLLLTGGILSSTAGGGSVTSVALSAPAFLSVGGSPITGSGTLALTFSGTALPIANGGTGGTTQATAQVALDVYSTGQSNANSFLNSLIFGG